MADSQDPPRSLPDVLRDADRPIIIYQGLPPNQEDALTSSLGLLSWLALLSVCLGVIVFSFWRVWNPAHDAEQYSPIYPQGRPVGLSRQIEERRLINADAADLIPYLDQIRADNASGRVTAAAHPLFSGRDGIDALRREWDDMCRSIREGNFDRELALIDARASELRRRRAGTSDRAAIADMDAQLASLARDRADQEARRRADGDPNLRCTTTALSPACGPKDDKPWCNPALKMPTEFNVGGARP